MEWWSVFRCSNGPFRAYILLAVSGRNFPSGGKIFEILTASEPRMDTNSHESALIPDFGLPYRRRCDRRSLRAHKHLHQYRWTKRVRWRTNDVLTIYGVTKRVTKVTKWLKDGGRRLQPRMDTDLLGETKETVRQVGDGNAESSQKDGVRKMGAVTKLLL